MRKSADWMTIWDDRILEILSDSGPNSPTPLSEHEYIHVNKSTVSRRLRKLKDHGLVMALGNGVYSITSKGQEYLDGELNAEDLRKQPSENDEGTHAGT